jgi:hypothetical protein
MSHIVPLWSPASDALSIELLVNKITAYPVAYPTVPKNAKRVRLVFHAGNTEEEVERIVKIIGEWLDERFKGEGFVAGVEAGLAETWEDFGKIKGLAGNEENCSMRNDIKMNGNALNGNEGVMDGGARGGVKVAVG